MTTQLAAPQPLCGWAQPTVATNWTADMLERLPVDVWTPATAPRTLRGADHLDGGDVVPSFRLPLAEIW